jgi:hypothetical protein
VISSNILFISKSRPGAKPFGNNGFIHFATMEKMMKGKNKSKEAFVLHRKMAPTSTSSMLPPPIPSSSHTMLPETRNALDLSSLAASAKLLTTGSSSNSMPNSILQPSPTFPYSFITSINPSVITSASHSDNKCKYSTLDAGASDISQKKQHTLSASI